MQIRSLSRRSAVIAASAVALAAICSTPVAVQAQQKNVKIAVIVPLSGPWARQGTLVKCGAETAVNEINAAGGIKALGGAKLELVAIDAGNSAEKAEERRAAPGRAGARRGRRHGRVALHVHARRNRSDRARPDPVADLFDAHIIGRGSCVPAPRCPGGLQLESTAPTPTILALAQAATGKGR